MEEGEENLANEEGRGSYFRTQTRSVISKGIGKRIQGGPKGILITSGASGNFKRTVGEVASKTEIGDSPMKTYLRRTSRLAALDRGMRGLP